MDVGKQEEHHFTQKTCDNWIEFTVIGFKQDKPLKIGLSQLTRISFKQQSCRYMMGYENGALKNQSQWRPSHFHQQVFSRGWRLSRTVDVGSFALDIAKGTVYKFQQVYHQKRPPPPKRTYCPWILAILNLPKNPQQHIPYVFPKSYMSHWESNKSQNKTAGCSITRGISAFGESIIISQH